MTVQPIRGLRRFRGLRSTETVEELAEAIARLVRERQSLRDRGAGAATLERNRVRIARAQWRLSHALIARYAAAERDAA